MGSGTDYMGSNDTVVWVCDEHSIKYESKTAKRVHSKKVDEAGH